MSNVSEKILDVYTTRRISSMFGTSDFITETRFVYTVDYLEDTKEYIFEYLTVYCSERNLVSNNPTSKNCYRVVTDYTLQKVIQNGFILKDRELRDEIKFITEILMRQKLRKNIKVQSLLTHENEQIREVVKEILKDNTYEE